MEKIRFYAPDIHIRMLKEIQNIPFAKTADGSYRFASWVYDLNYKQEEHDELLDSPCGQEADMLIRQTKEKLEKVLISDDDYIKWSIHRKESGGVAEYHRILRNLSVSLMMLSISYSADDIMSCVHKSEEQFYGKKSSDAGYALKVVLNRNNPFADVTIKSQQFFYKTADGSTETLFFNTNNVVDKTDKNDKGMLTMRPGFSVTKERGVAQKPMQEVTFSNTITEPVVNDEDHIYIHIDRV